MEQKNQNNVVFLGSDYHGERQAYICPFCLCHVKEHGDLRNPIAVIMGELICDDCVTKIRKVADIKPTEF